MNATQTNNDARWALITGAARRIGACLARSLHEHNYNVAIHYRGSAGDADTLAAELNAQRPRSAITVQADLLDVAQLELMVADVVRQTGRLDVLINKASTF